jgi:hypothetical protein
LLRVGEDCFEEGWESFTVWMWTIRIFRKVDEEKVGCQKEIGEI